MSGAMPDKYESAVIHVLSKLASEHDGAKAFGWAQAYEAMVRASAMSDAQASIKAEVVSRLDEMTARMRAVMRDTGTES